ncbi:hypothetical protein G6F56_012181 [Rhizopus delemar]|nr:hypothetical protein G6F56_012181 [Rhizopus delemar]
MLTSEILEKFVFERALNNDPRNKLVYLLGKVDEENCILSFEKTEFESKELSSLNKNLTKLTNEVENNIYRWALGQISVSELRVKVIYPATDLHIAKYEAQTRILLKETPEDYQQLTLPYIQSIPASRTQWVKNILNGEAEADRVIYRDDKMVVLPDMKWDGSTENLYWVALLGDLPSLRELRASDVEMLTHVRKECYRLLEKHNLSPHQVRIFFHYQPSYYHLHLHITSLSFVDAPGVVSGQAHLLDTVIDNLTLFPDYYQKATLPFLIGEKHALTVIFKERKEKAALK